MFLTFLYSKFKLFPGGGPYHVETSPLISSANQWTGFYMSGASVTKELILTLRKNNSYIRKCGPEKTLSLSIL